MVLGAIDSDGYKIVLILHILTVVIGIGAVMLNALYGAQAKARKGPEGLAIAEANFRVSMIAEYFIYAIPVFGIGLVFMSKSDGVEVFKFSQTWIWLSILLYIVALGISHGVVIPTAKKMQGLMRELNAMGPPPGAGGAGGAPAGGPPPGAGGPPPQVVQLEALGKKIGAGGATLNVLTVVIIFLMVWKPGF
ncbi:MAG: DUF2269 family protein [Acidimicrobiia bacterium]